MHICMSEKMIAICTLLYYFAKAEFFLKLYFFKYSFCATQCFHEIFCDIALTSYYKKHENFTFNFLLKKSH